jgi:hypothetical protein
MNSFERQRVLPPQRKEKILMLLPPLQTLKRRSGRILHTRYKSLCNLM